MASVPSSREKAVARGAPLVMLLLAGGGLAGVVFLLGQGASAQNAALIAGLAGATTATVALLIRPGGWRYLQGWIARYGAYVALIWFVGGFMVAAFGILAATTLLGARASLSGAAVSGALLGLAVGFIGAAWRRREWPRRRPCWVPACSEPASRRPPAWSTTTGRWSRRSRPRMGTW
jgi:hypothetical protein